MAIDVLIDAEEWQSVNPEALIESVVHAAFLRLELDFASIEVSFLCTGDAAVAKLNEQFRGKAQATNVLSWPSEDRAPETPGQIPPSPSKDVSGLVELGDVALAWETCVREADTLNIPIQDHVSHLALHGLLHLFGYDHETDEDALLMERLETEILSMIGISDPYQREA